MKALLKCGLGLALAWAASRGGAQEVQWRTAGPASAGAVRPVSLSRPVPLGEAASGAVVRGQVADERPQPFPYPPSAVAPSRPILVGGPKTTPPPAGTPEKIGPPRTVIPGPAPTQTHPLTVAPLPPEGVTVWGGTAPPINDPLGLGADGGCAPDCGACGPCGPLDGCGGGICGRGRGLSCWSNNCDGCCDTGRFWFSADYLLWFVRSQPTPPLVTQSPNGTSRALAGVLPDAQTLFNRVDNNPVSGARFQGVYWFPKTCNLGIDSSFFFLGPTRHTTSFASPGNPILSRPLIDANTGNEIAQLVSFPGVVGGSVTVQDRFRFWGADVNLRKRLYCGCNGWIDGLLGYRHLDLTEQLTITENLNVFQNGARVGNIIVNDSFKTQNRFNGGQIGLAGERRIGQRWFINGWAKIAFGNVHQTVTIDGTTQFSGFPAPAINGVRPGGVMALPSNIGSHSVDRFAVVPEVGFKVGMDVTQHLRLYAGYDFIYMSSVVRPGDQIDRVINRSQLPNVLNPGVPPLVGQPRPAVVFRTTDFWAQGVNFGMMYHW